MPLLEDFAVDWHGLDRAFAEGARRCCCATRTTRPGGCCTRAELSRSRRWPTRYGAHVIADEIHAPLTFAGEFVPWLSVSERGAALTSASKAFNLPGLKLGFVVGGAGGARLPRELRFHAGYAGVIAAEAAFRDGDAWLDKTIATIASNQARLPSLLPAGVRVADPAQASYLAWLDCRELGTTIPRRCSSSAVAWR